MPVNLHFSLWLLENLVLATWFIWPGFAKKKRYDARGTRQRSSVFSYVRQNQCRDLTENGGDRIGKSVGDIRYAIHRIRFAIADHKGDPWVAPTGYAHDVSGERASSGSIIRRVYNVGNAQNHSDNTAVCLTYGSAIIMNISFGMTTNTNAFTFISNPIPSIGSATTKTRI